MGVTSLPVPAVVGASSLGRPGPATRSVPTNASMGASCVTNTETTLATSSELPPPTPTSAVMLCRRANESASLTTP